jgi:hypothetical protein
MKSTEMRGIGILVLNSWSCKGNRQKRGIETRLWSVSGDFSKCGYSGSNKKGKIEKSQSA